MKDRYVIAIGVGLFVGWLALLHLVLIDRRPLRYVGLPEGATCTRDAQVQTCIAAGVEYRCAVDWSERVAQCAPAWRQRP